MGASLAFGASAGSLKNSESCGDILFYTLIASMELFYRAM
jgi:hypothetical protein